MSSETGEIKWKWQNICEFWIKVKSPQKCWLYYSFHFCVGGKLLKMKLEKKASRIQTKPHSVYLFITHNPFPHLINEFCPMLPLNRYLRGQLDRSCSGKATQVTLPGAGRPAVWNTTAGILYLSNQGPKAANKHLFNLEQMFPHYCFQPF